ncbi:MAD-domain-containing protein [Ganoderma leucocontextum]|nr:MAD-domain-containing protein [Ganoderma leucocontextum]
MPDPQLSTAKRQQRTQAFSSHVAHASLERQLAAAQTTKLELESKLREKDLLIERLEGDRRWLAEREKEEREEKEREREEALETKRKADSELRSLRNQLTTLRDQHVDLEDEHSILSRSASQTISSQKSQVSTLIRQVSLLEKQLEEFRHLAEERAHAFDELQAQFDELNAAQDSMTLSHGQDEDWTVVREELHRQAKYMHQLETANAKMTAELNVLREKQTSVEVLKEQKRDLERKLRGADELREQVVKLEAELDAARQEREEWASTAQPATPSKTPVSVTQSLSNLRLTHAKLMEEHGSNVALLRHRDQTISELQTREAQVQETVKSLRNEIRDLKDRAARSEHKSALSEREVSFLQAMMASFNAENAANNDVKLEDDTSKPLQQLEALVKDYKETVLALERELKHARENPVVAEDVQAKQQVLAELEEVRVAKEEAEQALKEAESESEKQLEQIEELEQTLFELRGEIGGGRHLPPGVRVLSLRDNPAQQWEDLSKAAMDRLKGENEALLKRLKELEESGIRGLGQSASKEDLVPRESYEGVRAEMLKLEKELRDKDKRLQRLREIYGRKSEEFREATASILGVKLVFYPNGGVRVTSQFDLNAVFVFKPTDSQNGGNMQLIEQGDGGPEDLPQLMRYWIEEQGCIPGFLASITLECYDKHKRELALDTNSRRRND